MVIYSVYDKVSKTFGPLSSGLNEEVVKRNMRLSVMNDQTIKMSISDYSLHFFGEYNERTGEIILASVDQVRVVPFSELLEVSSDA